MQVATSASPLFIDITRIVSDIFGFLAILVIIRILFSWFPHFSVYRNPVTRFIANVVDPMLNPIRRFMPSMGGLDFSPIVLIVILDVISNVIGNLPYDVATPGGILAAIGVQIVLAILTVILLLVLVRFLLSVFHADPYHPIVQMIQAASNPFVAPFRVAGKKGPRSGVHPVDVPAIIAFVVYAVIYIVLGFVFSII